MPPAPHEHVVKGVLMVLDPSVPALTSDGLPIPTREELVARAAAMVPTLRERSAECEQLGRIPDATIDDFKRSGLLRIASPPAYGGYGYTVAEISEVTMEIGRGCASTAWMAGQWPGHQFMVGYFGKEAQDEYFATGYDTMSSTASAQVRLDVAEEAGGLRVSGHLKMLSGCDAAEWILLIIPPYGMHLVPRSDFRVEHDWHVSGLGGTGSKSVIMDDIFIPSYRSVSTEALTNGSSYGALHYDDPYYKVPMGNSLNTLLLASTIGAARGLVELFDERVRVRIDTHTGDPAYTRPGTQLRFGEASAAVDAAILIERQILADLAAWGRAGGAPSREARARVRRDIGYATRLCVTAGDLLLESGDASGHYSHQLVQRFGRDLHMAGLQASLTFDEPAMSYSQLRWGLEPQSRLT